MLRPSDDDHPRSFGKVSCGGYIVLTFLLVLFDFHIGVEHGSLIDLGLVPALLWFGIGLLVEGSYGYWRGSKEARVVALWGAVSTGIGVFLLVFIGMGGPWAWVGGGVGALICIALYAVQKGITLNGALDLLALLAAAIVAVAIIAPRTDVNHSPSPQAIKQARGEFNNEGSQAGNNEKKSNGPATRFDSERPQQGKLSLPDEEIASRRSSGLGTLALAESSYRSGVRFEEDGLSKEAISDYKQAIAYKPDYPDALNRLALILTRTGQLNDAIAYFKKALALVPTNAATHRNLGSALQMAGRTEEADREFAAAEQLDHQ
jgi:hypothetical protein